MYELTAHAGTRIVLLIHLTLATESICKIGSGYRGQVGYLADRDIESAGCFGGIAESIPETSFVFITIIEDACGKTTCDIIASDRSVLFEEGVRIDHAGCTYLKPCCRKAETDEDMALMGSYF